MRETDVTRDNAAGAISSVINALLKSPVDERRHAAELLYQQMSPYRGIGRHEYNKETAEIRGMLAMLAETDNAAAVTTLGLSPEVEALREANAAFEEAFDARNDEVSLQQEQRSISSADATAEANRLYQEIVQTVNAYAIVQPTDEINAFIDKLNGLTGSLASVSGGTASGGEGAYRIRPYNESKFLICVSKNQIKTGEKSIRNAWAIRRKLESCISVSPRSTRAI